MLKKIVPLLLLCTVCCVSQTFAGAWTQQSGSSYNRLTLNYYSADHNFDNDGDRKEMSANGKFTDTNLNYYVEYGITDDLTVIGSAYYKQIKHDDDSIEIKTYGIGDVDLGLKYRLLNLPAGALAVQGLVKVPELYDENDTMPLGNGQYDYEMRLLFGQSLAYLFPGYFNVEFGYRWRAEEPSDEYRYLVEVGSDITAKTYLRVKLDGLISANNGDSAVYVSGNPTMTTEYDLLKLDVAFGYRIDDAWGWEAVYTPALSGENTAVGATYAFALTYKIK
ncbi:MAG: hypothetical protein RBR22_04720 [Desulfuromonas sp.]|nr:hypothetical protein [Desulfuromonas sp.]